MGPMYSLWQSYQKEIAMQRNFMRSAIMLVFAMLSQLANAFVDPPTLSPTNPTEGQTVSVSIRVGQCDALGEVPGYPQITQTGNAIRILLHSIRVYDSEFCNVPILIRSFPVGVYPAGAYTVQVDRTYEVPLPPQTIVETLGILPFTVSGAPAPAVLPTTGFIGLLTLFATILFIAVPVLRRRQCDRNAADV